jgi:hypothetical protein
METSNLDVHQKNYTLLNSTWALVQIKPQVMFKKLGMGKGEEETGLLVYSVHSQVLSFGTVFQ